MILLFVSVFEAELLQQFALGRMFERGGDKVTFVTLSRKGCKALRRHGADVCSIQDIARDVARERPVTPAAVAAAEARYGLVSLRDLYLADRATPAKPEAWVIAESLRLLWAWERYFDTHPGVEWVIPDVGAELIRRTAYHVCRRRGVRQILWFTKPLPNPLLLVNDDFHTPLVKLEEIRVARLPPEQREAAHQFLEAFRRDTSPFVQPRYIVVSWRRLGRFLRMVLDAATVERGYQEHLRPFRFLRHNLRRWINVRLFRSLVYRPVPRAEPFVLFPLHVTDDFKTSVMAPHCVHQDYFVRLCADALPQGYRLVVKEHPSCIGGERLSWMRSLARIPNVRIVPPETSIKRLIAQSAAVAVLSSTTGLEALFFGKSVVTFGKPFYSGLGLTFDVNDVREVRRVMRDAVASGGPDMETLRTFIALAMERTYPAKPPMVDRSTENLDALYRSLSRHMAQCPAGSGKGA